MAQQIADDVMDIMAQKALVDRSKLDLDVKLADLNVSSLDMVEVIFALEDKYGIQTAFNANTSSGDIKTVGDVINLVKNQIQHK